MRRKPVERRLESISRLRAILRSSRDRLDRRLRRLLAARSDAGFSYRPIVDHLDDELVAAEHRLAGAEDAYALAQLQPPSLRRQRDELAAKLYDHYNSTRRFLASAMAHRYGAALADPAPRPARPLIRHVRLTTNLFRCLKRDSPALAGVRIDPRPLVGELAARADQLEAVLETLETADVAVSSHRESADRALAEADRVASWVARGLEGLYRLGGLDGLADRIRASARR